MSTPPCPYLAQFHPSSRRSSASSRKSSTTRRIVSAAASRRGGGRGGASISQPYGAYAPLCIKAADRSVELFLTTVFGEALGAQFSKRPYSDDLRIDLARLFSDYAQASLIDEVERISDDNVVYDFTHQGR